MIFLSPYYLVFLLLLPLFHYLTKKRAEGSIRFSAARWAGHERSASVRMREFLVMMTYLILALLIVAAARPQLGVGGGRVPTEGIDMAMIIDVSGSMKTVDNLEELRNKPGAELEHRLSKVKRVSRHFVKNRKGDRIGLVAFAGRSIMINPLTQDYKLLEKQIETLDFSLTTDGTALGMALVSGINLLKDSERKEKAIIVLSDGINNSGNVEPIQAAYLAKNYDIKIYPIEMGSFINNEIARAQSNWEGTGTAEPKLLEKIAAFTGGKNFTVPDGDHLYAVYNEIEKVEKSKLDVDGYADYIDIFPYLTGVALLLLTVQIVLLNTRYMKVP